MEYKLNKLKIYKTVSTISEFVSCIETIKEYCLGQNNNNDLLFRGQCNDYELNPKILRYPPRANNLKLTEKIMVKEFMRFLPLVFDGHITDNEWQILTAAQHYGLPTRFLDWSYSSLIALWFAVHNNKEVGFVYIFITKKHKIWNAWEKYSTPIKVKKTVLYRPSVISDRVRMQNSVFSVQPLDDDEISSKNTTDYEIKKNHYRKLCRN